MYCIILDTQDPPNLTDMKASCATFDMIYESISCKAFYNKSKRQSQNSCIPTGLIVNWPGEHHDLQCTLDVTSAMVMLVVPTDFPLHSHLGVLKNMGKWAA